MEAQNNIELDSKFFLDVLENMSSGIIALREDETYYFVNIAGLNLLGISKKFPKLITLKASIGHHSLSQHIKSVKEENHTKMIRDFKFKNFEGDEKIVDCNIS